MTTQVEYALLAANSYAVKLAKEKGVTSCIMIFCLLPHHTRGQVYNRTINKHLELKGQQRYIYMNVDWFFVRIPPARQMKMV